MCFDTVGLCLTAYCVGWLSLSSPPTTTRLLHFNQALGPLHRWTNSISSEQIACVNASPDPRREAKIPGPEQGKRLEQQVGNTSNPLEPLVVMDGLP